MATVELEQLQPLLPCPPCGETLEIRSGVNPYGRHSKDAECLFAGRAINIPLDVAAWNRRSPAPSIGEAWQPIATAPKDGREVLVYGSYLYPGDFGVTSYWSIASYCGPNGPNQLGPAGWEDDEGVHLDGYFSHWQPLFVPSEPRGRAYD